MFAGRRQEGCDATTVCFALFDAGLNAFCKFEDSQQISECSYLQTDAEFVISESFEVIVFLKLLLHSCSLKLRLEVGCNVLSPV